MMKRKILTLALSYILLLTSLPVFSKEISLEEKTQNLQEMLNLFESMCMDENGKVLDRTVVVDRDGILNNGESVNCPQEAKRLSLLMEGLEKETSKIVLKETKNNGKAICPAQGQGATPLISQKETQGILKVVNDPKFNNQNSYSNAQCFQDIACNVLRSSVLRPVMYMQKILNTTANSCLDIQKSDCASEFVAGVLKDLWSNIEGIWELLKMGGTAIKNGTKKLAKATWGLFVKVENKSSDAALAASHQSEGMIQQFKKNPLEFIKEFAKGIMDFIGESIKENFGCEKWDGVPHMSNCLSPMKNWDDANCDQKMNAICGVAGVLGGEILVAYLTGGALTLGKNATAQTTAKVTRILEKTFPNVSKISKGIIKGAKVIAKPVYQLTELTKALFNSKAALAIKEFLQNSKGIALSTLKPLSKAQPLKVTVKVLKGATSPIRSYMKLLDKSFEMGMAKGEALSAKVMKGAKLEKFSETMSKAEKLGDIDEIVVNTKQFDNLSPDVMKMRLKENSIPYEEITTANGQKAIRIKQQPGCSKLGNGSILLK